MKKMSFYLSLIAALFALFFSACSAIQVRPGAERILVTRNAPEKGCTFLGTVMGSQGNAFTGGWTSNKNLSAGAMNAMKNEAYSLGANYVQIETDRTGNTTSGSTIGGHGSISGQQTDVTMMGNAYKCPMEKVE